MLKLERCMTTELDINIEWQHKSATIVIHSISHSIRAMAKQLVTATAQIRSKASSISSLEALSVNDGGSALVIFLFRDPHLLEG